jgi:hypothetical protein
LATLGQAAGVPRYADSQESVLEQRAVVALRRRVREEFNILKRLSLPCIVEVYRYDGTHYEYKMEFCYETLRN